MIEDLKTYLLLRIEDEGLEAVAESFIRQGKNGFASKMKHKVAMTPAEERCLRFQQKVGMQIHNALLGQVEGVRTNELAVENVMSLLRRKPHLRNHVRRAVEK